MYENKYYYSLQGPSFPKSTLTSNKLYGRKEIIKKVHVQRRDNREDDVSNQFGIPGINKRMSHLTLVAGELYQRKYREWEGERKHHLAYNQQVVDFVISTH